MPLIKHHWMIPLVKPYSKSSRRSNHCILLDLLLRSWKKHKFASFFEICFIFIWVWLGWSVDLGCQRLLTPSFANSEVRPGITSWHRALLSSNAAMPQCRNAATRKWDLALLPTWLCCWTFDETWKKHSALSTRCATALDCKCSSFWQLAVSQSQEKGHFAPFAAHPQAAHTSRPFLMSCKNHLKNEHIYIHM